jgi:hypothetical protein
VRHLLLAALYSLLVATASFAQIPGKIGVYADAAATNCYIVDDGGVVEAHMLHVLTDGAIGLSYRLDASATDWIHLGDNWEFELVLGSSVEGVSIAYTECLSGSIYLGVALFMGSSEPPCTEVSIVGDPKSITGEIEAISCSDTRMFPAGGRAVINADQTCQCTVPVEITTWGTIKALYR